MAKIVIDARESGTSTGRYVDKLIEHLHKQKPEHSVILLAHAERTEYLSNIAPGFVILQTPFKEFTFSEQIGFLRQIRGLDADLVHFTMVQQPIMYTGNVVTTMHDLVTVRFRNPTKNPVVFFIKQRIYAWVNRRAAHKSIAVITPTQYVKDDIVKFAHIKPDKVFVTYEAADQMPAGSEPVPGLENTPFIMYIGRPTPHKNLGRLIEAHQKLLVDHPDLKLVLVGKIDGNYLLHKARIEKEGLQGVLFTDFVSDAQLRWLFEHCGTYVFPSLSEGFGLPALEAMMHGAPVASSNATCLPEVYGDAANYFDPLNVTEMAAKIGEILDDPILREDLVEKGKAQAATYSWERLAKQTLAIYEQALSKAK